MWSVHSVGSVFTRPATISDPTILEFVTDLWTVDADRSEYSTVGFGSHHWLLGTADGWKRFITVDDLVAKRRSPLEPLEGTFDRLQAAFTTARDLADAGHDFVLAPDRSRHGEILHHLDERFTVACVNWVDGVAGDYGQYHSETTRETVAGYLVVLHDVGLGPVPHCRFEDFEVSNRGEFEDAWTRMDEVWDTGPHAETARELLRCNVDTVAERFEKYDDLVVSALAVRDQWVVTHGEPHGSNVLTTAHDTRLIDWDTALIAPRERDIWHMDSDDRSAAAIYSAAGGPKADAELLDMYRLQWDLMEIAGYITLFCDAHEDTEDTRESLQNLRHYIAPRL